MPGVQSGKQHAAPQLLRLPQEYQVAIPTTLVDALDE
jgi:hypothetical protein